MSHGQRILNHPAGATGGGGGGGPWVMVQGIGAGTIAGSLGVQYASNIGTGHLLIATAVAYASFTGISDSGGRTWTQQAAFAAPNTAPLAVWTAPSGTGGTRPTVTVTLSSGQFLTVLLGEFSGVDVTTTPISVSATDGAVYLGGAGPATASAGPTAASGAHEAGCIYVAKSAAGDVNTHTGYTEVAHVVAASGSVLGAVLAVIDSNSAAFTGIADLNPPGVGEYGSMAFCLKLA